MDINKIYDMGSNVLRLKVEFAAGCHLDIYVWARKYNEKNHLSVGSVLKTLEPVVQRIERSFFSRPLTIVGSIFI